MRLSLCGFQRLNVMRIHADPHVWCAWYGVCSSPFPWLWVALPPMVSVVSQFQSQPHLFLFYCLQYGLFSMSNSEVCSANLQVVFWVISMDVDIM